MTEHATFSCDDFDRTLADYLAHRQSEHHAQRVERHASECARCEELLDHATRGIVAFAPPLPVGLRDVVMQSIASAPVLSIVRDAKPDPTTRVPVQRAPSFRRAAIAMLAVAAALTVVLVSNREEPNVPVVAATTPSDANTRTVDTSAITAPILDHDIGFVYTAARVAIAQAQAEFEVLDNAAQELEAALTQTPNDRELRAFLASVRARRDELTRRVREATS